MTRAGLAAVLALAMLAPGLPAIAAAQLADAPEPAREPAAGHDDAPGLLVREDPDGGRSIRATVDDAPGGTYRYEGVHVDELKDAIERIAGEQAPDEPVREVGLYEHEWERAGSPMLTVGAYARNTSDTPYRLPLVVFENVTASGEVANRAAQLVLNAGPNLATPVLPFLLESALVTMADAFQSYPEEDLDTYEDKPTIYAWQVRKVESGHEVWTGQYLRQTGESGGQREGEGAYDARLRVEVGAAVRTEAGTQHGPAAYLEATASREGDESRQSSTWTLTAGVHAAGEDQPVTTVEASDVRTDDEGDLSGTPDEQRTRTTLAAWAGDERVPLLAVQTRATHDTYPCPTPPEGQPAPLTDCVDQTRTHSLGVFPDGDYEPVLGLQATSERATVEEWPFAFLAGGGPGAQNVGAFEVTAGAFVDGDYEGLAGARVADGFEGARDPFATQVTAGTAAGEGWTPVVGATYDGHRPSIPWAEAYYADDHEELGRWMASSGVFADDAYVPAVGVAYTPWAKDGTREHQHRFVVGTYLLDYRLFVPLADAHYDGTHEPRGWALAYTFAGGPGAQGLAFDAGVGAYAADTYLPLLRVNATDGYDSPDGEYENEQRIDVLGPGVGGEPEPIVGVYYRSDETLVDAHRRPLDQDDDARYRLTVGVYVEGEFVPVLAVVHDAEGTTVTPAPGTY